ncbi:hypothetical protein ACIP5Y_45655 [Nocardia sp. NPDC088792]|uniref:hypothetical protein n=1 Tax=Nocardia sp. NPDC088792 TaxID=3364332 RepID=UPI003830D672
MATGVGLRIADDESVVAVVTGDDATLPVHYIVRESVLHMSDDGDAVLGGPQPDGYTHSISGFVGAVGDPAGLPVDDGEAYRAEDLMATAAFCLINLAADHLNGPAEFYATHPTGWTEAQVRSLREALDYLGLKSLVLVSERDLPPPDAEAGKSLAYNAARAALAAVLSTPAGLTPPDATASTANAADVTDVLPALPAAVLAAQAYSAAVPAVTTAEPEVSDGDPADPTASTAPAKSMRGAYLIAATAAVLGLLLGGLGVAAVLRQHEDTPGPPRGEVRSEPDATAGVLPPLQPQGSGSDSTTPPAPVAESPAPETSSDPPPVTTTPPPPPTTITPPPATTPPSTRTTPPTTTVPLPPIYRYPPVPNFDYPVPPVLQDPWGMTPQ